MMTSALHALLLALPLHLADFSQAEFKRVIGRAQTVANDRLEADFLQTKQKSVTDVQMIDGQGGGTWRMMALGWGRGNGDKVDLRRLPVLIKNHGNRAEFWFALSPMSAEAIRWMQNETKVGKVIERILKERSHASPTFKVQEGRLVFSAWQPYDGSAEQVGTQLGELVTDARHLLIEAMQVEEKASKVALEAVQKKPAGPMSPQELLALLDDGLTKLTIKTEGADKKVNFKFEGRDYDIYFYEKSFYLSANWKFKEGISTEDFQAKIKAVKAWTDANPFYGSEVRVRPWGTSTNWMQVAVHIPLDGSLTGKEVEERYKEFFYKYTDKAYKKL